MPYLPPDIIREWRLDQEVEGAYTVFRKEDGMEWEGEEDYFMDGWDDYEVDPEREWERVWWIEDMPVPLDSNVNLG